MQNKNGVWGAQSAAAGPGQSPGGVLDFCIIISSIQGGGGNGFLIEKTICVRLRQNRTSVKFWSL